MLRRLCAELLDRVDYLLTLVRLTVLDWLAPLPESRRRRPTEQSESKANGCEGRSLFSTSADGNGENGL
jgi:hypothetical protein